MTHCAMGTNCFCALGILLSKMVGKTPLLFKKLRASQQTTTIGCCQNLPKSCQKRLLYVVFSSLKLTTFFRESDYLCLSFVAFVTLQNLISQKELHLTEKMQEFLRMPFFSFARFCREVCILHKTKLFS